MESQESVLTTKQSYEASQRPVGQLKTNRSIIVTFLLSIITFCIYAIVVYCGISNDLNVIASRYDGRRTMNFALLMFVVGPLTLGIGYIVWNHKICNRIGFELQRRNIDYSISASTYWLWSMLGSLIIIGPIVYVYKLFKAMNLLCEHYNYHG